MISEQLPSLNSRKAPLWRQSRLVKKSLAFLFEEINALKRQVQSKADKTTSSKKKNKEG
jgi:hypothetical protein